MIEKNIFLVFLNYHLIKNNKGEFNMKTENFKVAAKAAFLFIFIFSFGLKEINAETIKWTMGTSWPSGMIVYETAEHFAKKVKEMSQGRLDISVKPAGAVVGPLDVLDAASKGSIDAAHSCANYWPGKNISSQFFGSVPMLFEPLMQLVWVYEGGGLELWNKMYTEKMKLNVITLPLGMTHGEILAWSNKPLKGIDDFKGLKYRTLGWWGEILKANGTSVTMLPGGEVFSALERGVIDAAEFNTPYADYQLGFFEIAKYYVGPAMHQPSTMLELIINKDKWNALPNDLKVIVEEAAKSTTIWAWTYEINKSMKALEEYENKGNIRIIVDEKSQREFREVAWKHLDKIAETDEFFKEVWDSARTFYLRFVDYEDFMIPVRPENKK